MKRKLSALLERYVAALKHHLKQGPRASLKPARALGHQAVAAGLETLDVARIHRQAIATLDGSASRAELCKRADVFFGEAVAPIEGTHRTALQADARLKKLNETLSQRTQALVRSGRSLRKGIVQRKAVEAALRKSGEHYKTLLEESLALEARLQHLTHRVLLAHEAKRKEISHDLQDEIAQTLLAINVRLLTVRKAAGLRANGLQKEIAGTQRLVNMSKKTIERFAREYGKL
jgi:signal transduction histidine kinase